VEGKAEPQGGTTAQARTWYVYLVRAQNGALYCGISDNTAAGTIASPSAARVLICRCHTGILDGRAAQVATFIPFPSHASRVAFDFKAAPGRAPHREARR
jgi:hypothetical protein